ncbi:MAG: NTP transferase domain-containing protein [Friedmanniella sp.]
MSLPPETVVAVVLAGGTSRRFGRDKLAEPWGDGATTLLDAVLAGLPEGIEVLVVGPERATARRVRFVREDPPGGGPGAALVTGLRAALAAGAGRIAVLPADAPAAGRAAAELLGRLGSSPGQRAVVATDEEGREQPLQLALVASAARALVAAAPGGGDGASARALLRNLDPPATRVALGPEVLFDIDTPTQLMAWRLQSSAAVDTVLDRVAEVAPAARPRPVVVALTGPPGSGRSTMAQALRLRAGAVVLSAADLPDRSLRAALDALRQQSVAGRAPTRLVVVDGPPEPDPELADLVDLTVPVAATTWTRSGPELGHGERT